MADHVFVPKEKVAQVSTDILPVIRDRWSPYAFSSEVVAEAKIEKCLVAASWAASSYNEQPWYFLVAYREQTEQFERMLSCLLEANQSWARPASVLLLTVSQETFSRNGTPNRVHQYDLGQAVAQFALQATAEGLAVHQMAGIHIGKIRAEYQIPDGFSPQTGIAVGYAAQQPSSLIDEEFIRRDRSARQRKPLEQFVFQGGWGKTKS
jgi:nitroreductase